jgi:hypothetical protein
VVWYGFMALMAPMREESKPFMVDTRYPTPMIMYSWIMFLDHNLGFWASRAAAVVC